MKDWLGGGESRDEWAMVNFFRNPCESPVSSRPRETQMNKSTCCTTVDHQ
jgi:hypothetical protein